MSISIKRCGTGAVVLVLLLLGDGRLAAQTTTSSADQAVKDLPQQVRTNGENKLVTKTNTVSNNAADKVDTLGTKAYKGFVGMFKKKKKPLKDSVAPAKPGVPATPVTPGAPSTPPRTESMGTRKSGFVTGAYASFSQSVTIQ